METTENERLRVRDSAQRPGIAQPVEDRNRLPGEREKLVGTAFGSAKEAKICELDPCPQLGSHVGLRPGQVERLLQQALGTVDVATSPEDERKLGQEIAPDDVSPVEKRGGPCEQIRRSVRVTALCCAKTRRSEPIAGVRGEAAGAPVGRTGAQSATARALELLGEERISAGQLGDICLLLGWNVLTDLLDELEHLFLRERL